MASSSSSAELSLGSSGFSLRCESAEERVASPVMRLITMPTTEKSRFATVNTRLRMPWYVIWSAKTCGIGQPASSGPTLAVRSERPSLRPALAITVVVSSGLLRPFFATHLATGSTASKTLINMSGPTMLITTEEHSASSATQNSVVYRRSP